jgi:hypothetical protein
MRDLVSAFVRLRRLVTMETTPHILTLAARFPEWWKAGTAGGKRAATVCSLSTAASQNAGGGTSANHRRLHAVLNPRAAPASASNCVLLVRATIHGGAPTPVKWLAIRLPQNEGSQGSKAKGDWQ